jgi:hypothetical protein
MALRGAPLTLEEAAGIGRSTWSRGTLSRRAPYRVE